jgi:hypothetical protein
MNGSGFGSPKSYSSSQKDLPVYLREKNSYTVDKICNNYYYFLRLKKIILNSTVMSQESLK